jgi:hypothetical protein
VVAEEVDEALFGLEPEDIHMVYWVPPSKAVRVSIPDDTE